MEDRYRIIHTTTGWEADENSDLYGAGFESRTILWRGDNYPTREERIAANLSALAIENSEVPYTSPTTYIEHRGPTLQELRLKAISPRGNKVVWKNVGLNPQKAEASEARVRGMVARALED